MAVCAEGGLADDYGETVRVSDMVLLGRGTARRTSPGVLEEATAAK